MRWVALVALATLVACSSARPAPNSNATHPATDGSCRLPVYWHEGREPLVHAAFVSFPDGVVTDVGIIPPLQLSYGASYVSAAKKWFGATRALLSPDGTRYAYWTTGPPLSEVHVVDLATGANHVVYTGTTTFFVIAFRSEGLYLVNAVNAKQGVFEKLYRLDPAGGTPQLVPGSDRHMYQWGWLLIDDGAAWGIDYRVNGGSHIYSVLRLDLASSVVTQWLEAPPDDLFWPLGLDGEHGLYVGDGREMWRVGPPSEIAQLMNAESAFVVVTLGGPIGFVSDSHGAWIAGLGGVVQFSNPQESKRLAVGPADANVFPAGPCL